MEIAEKALLAVFALFALLAVLKLFASPLKLREGCSSTRFWALPSWGC